MNTLPHPKRCIVWIVDGDYVHEAAHSAEGIARFNSDADLVLATPSPMAAYTGAFDKVLALPPRQSAWYLDSTRYWAEQLPSLGYDQYLVLDSDVAAIAPFGDLWTLLTRFDLVAAHAIARQTANTMSKVPGSFPELNIGVVGWRNNPQTREFFAKWFARYSTDLGVYGNNDQAPFREALWLDGGKLSLYVLPPEYNCKWWAGGFKGNGPVRFLHGRTPDLARVSNEVNRIPSMRGWRAGDF